MPVVSGRLVQYFITTCNQKLGCVEKSGTIFYVWVKIWLFKELLPEFLWISEIPTKEIELPKRKK